MKSHVLCCCNCTFTRPWGCQTPLKAQTPRVGVAASPGAHFWHQARARNADSLALAVASRSREPCCPSRGQDDDDDTPGALVPGPGRVMHRKTAPAHGNGGKRVTRRSGEPTPSKAARVRVLHDFFARVRELFRPTHSIVSCAGFPTPKQAKSR